MAKTILFEKISEKSQWLNSFGIGDSLPKQTLEPLEPLLGDQTSNQGRKMCFFISLVVSGGDPKEIDMVLRRHGRRATPINNASVRCKLLSDEDHFLTTVGVCDCGTVLSPYCHDDDRRKKERSKQVSKLRKKGWSAAKIERWIVDRTKSAERAEEQRYANAPDSIEQWTRIIGDLMNLADVKQAGLLLHFYSGDIESEALETKRKVVSFRDFVAQLRDIEEDQILFAMSDGVEPAKFF